MLVGLIFYVQLKSIIEPLTPQSIPLNVDRLENAIERNNFLFRLLYQEQLVESNLREYVLTQRLESFQDYNMNKYLLDQLLVNNREVYPNLWGIIEGKLLSVEHHWDSILQFMKSGNYIEARKQLQSQEYITLMQDVRNSLDRYTKKFDVAENESAIVSLKVATKNTTAILNNSLNKTVLIFIDALIISIFLAYLSSRAILRPINLLKNEMKNLNVDDHSKYINPKLGSIKGEVGTLSRSFVSLINRLRSTTVSRNKLLLEIERRKAIEQDLRTTTNRLKETINDLDQFSYSVSHDLREPLRGIENLSDWIIEDCYDLLPDDSRKHLELMKNRVQRLSLLITGILEYARAGKVKENIEEVDLAILIHEIIDTLSPPQNIKIHIEDKLPTFALYKSAITQVFLNLISNAIKYNDKKEGNIYIGFKEFADYYQFYVKDQGPGIDPKYHEKIFQMFQTLQSRDLIEGAGIGLALVKKIVENQEGEVWIESALGEGATFYFTWPK